MGKVVTKEQLSRMEEEAVWEMLHYHEKGGKQKLKDMARRAAGRYVPPRDLIFWPTAMIANSLTEWGLEEKTLPAIKAYFDRWIESGMPIYYVDDALAGVSLIDLYGKTKEEKYREGADRLADYLFRLKKEAADARGSIPYRPSQGNGHIYADGVGMMSSFLVKYGIAFGQFRAVETGLLQLRNMLLLGMDEETGLPYHGFQYENGVKYGIIGWGRAVGWIFMCLARILVYLKSYLEGKDGREWGNDKLYGLCEAAYGEFAGACLRLFQAVRPYQKENGAFGWQLEALEGPEDSSATGMIAYGAVMGAQGLQLSATDRGNGRRENGSPEEWAGLKGMESVITDPGDGRRKAVCLADAADFRQLADRAAKYLAGCERDGKIFQCSAECLGFSQYPQTYGAYPWSLGPGLGVLQREWKQ